MSLLIDIGILQTGPVEGPGIGGIIGLVPGPFQPRQIRQVGIVGEVRPGLQQLLQQLGKPVPEAVQVRVRGRVGGQVVPAQGTQAGFSQDAQAGRVNAFQRPYLPLMALLRYTAKRAAG